MRRDHASDRRVARKEVILADDIAQLPRPQLVGKRARRRIFEERFALIAAWGAGARWAHRTLTAKSCPPRRMPNVHGPSPAIAAFNPSTDAIGLRLTLAMVSPCSSPRRSARLPGSALSTTTPLAAVGKPSSSASAGLRFATVAPAGGVPAASAVIWRGGISGNAVSTTSTETLSPFRHSVTGTGWPMGR